MTTSFREDLKASAKEKFRELGFPHQKLEDWRFTNLNQIKSTKYFKCSFKDSVNLEGIQIPFFENTHQIVIANGSLQKDFPFEVENVEIETLFSVLNTTPEKIENHFAKIANYETHAFLAKNTQKFVDGLYIKIPKNVVVKKPIHIINITKSKFTKPVTYPRFFVHAETGSQVEIIEHFVSENKNILTNTCTEILAEENSNINYYRVQDEGDTNNHFSYIGIEQHSHSNVTCQTFSLSGKFIRNDVMVNLDGIGAEINLHGIFTVEKSNFVDNHTTINHNVEHCISKEMYKGVLRNNAHGVFSGMINVEPHAHHTDSFMENRNLLLSESSQMNSNPQLVINCDEVRCSHGSTTGQIDEDALFYLRSRGLSITDAHLLLISGFVNEVIDNVKFDDLKQFLNKIIQSWIIKS